MINHPEKNLWADKTILTSDLDRYLIGNLKSTVVSLSDERYIGV